MKVVHLTRTTIADTTGGLEYHVAYLTDALRKRGHQVDIIQTEAAQMPDRDSNAGANRSFRGLSLGPRINGYIGIARMFLRRLSRNWKARDMLRSVTIREADIIHQHCYLAAIVMSWLLSRKHPVVFTNHTGAYLYLNRWSLTRELQRRLMSNFAAVIAPSRELLPEVAHSHYIPNGVDTSVFYPVREDRKRQLREKWKFGDKRIFVCPRRWAPTKGIIYLAEAISHLDRETREKSIFVFAGNVTSGYAQYQRSVRAALERVDSGIIRILGNLNHSELAELLKVADVCVIPSLMEATSLACLEAMACGVPVIVTADTGMKERIADRE